MAPASHSSTLATVTRRFPLLGRPRPSCPSLPERVHEVADNAHAAGQASADKLAEGAHALNMAALIASDCGLPALARDLCWQHIDRYRAAVRPLTVRQARHLLEPVLNLARLQLRAYDGDQALRLLTAMFQAVRTNTDLAVDGRILPLADLSGTRAEHHKLHEWVWLHLISDGIRALTLAGRWDDAVAHAQTHRGIGLHLMEGRQAVIVSNCINADLEAARAALADSTPRHPWELQVASCLKVMCAGPYHASTTNAMITRYVEHRPAPGYAVFRAQLGLTVAALADATDVDAASRIHAQVADEAIASGDGYAAREVLHCRRTTATDSQRAKLTNLVHASGLGTGEIPASLRQRLLDSVHTAAEALSQSLRQPDQPSLGTSHR